MEETFQAMLNEKPAYFQLRLISIANNGLKHIRIDIQDEKSVSIPPDRLQKNGETAIGSSKVFDIALLDLQLPDMRGLKLAEKIRNQWPQLPMLAVTAQAGANVNAGSEPLRSANFTTTTAS